jgi:endonuclease YncB( thermonuclease family)
VLAGVPRVIDGDTLVVSGSHIRLHGIDAPESEQTCNLGTQIYACGALATAALRDLLQG